MFNFTPQLVAGGTIKPYSVVKVDTTAWQGVAASANTDLIAGVTDGSTRRFDSENHAASGDPISLQPSPTVQVVRGATATNVVAGDPLTLDTNASSQDGSVMKATASGNVPLFVALEPATATGQVFWAYRLGSVRALA